MTPTRTSRGPNAATSAKLPGIQASRIDDIPTRQAIEALREWVEVRLGARGDPFERAVTKRELLSELDKFKATLGAAATSSTTTVQSTSQAAVDLTAINRQITDLQDAIARVEQTTASGDESLQLQIDSLNQLLANYTSIVAASSVTVADALGYFAGADVETVLSEIWSYITSQVDGPISPDTPPLIPVSPDDEFEFGAAIDSAGARLSGAKPWSWVNQGAATATVTQGALVIKAPTSATGDLRGVTQPVRGEEWVYRAKLSGLTLTAANVAMVGMFCRNSATGQIVGSHKSFNTGAKLEVSHWTSASAYSSTPTSVDVFSAPWLRSLSDEIYLEIELSGGMLSFRFSDSGVDGTFNQFASESVSGFIGSVDEVGLCCANINNADPVVGAWDWFRQTGSALLVSSYGGAGPNGSVSLMQLVSIAAVGAAYPSGGSDITLAASFAPSGDPYWDNVALLLHGEGADGGTMITDSSSRGRTPDSAYGTTTSTAQKKFGSTSLYGTSSPTRGIQYSLSAGAVNDILTGDFTVELWFYSTAAITTNQVLFDLQLSIHFMLWFTTTGKLSLNLNNTAIDGTTTVSQNAWHHVAWVKSGGTSKVYLDGVQELTTTVATSTPDVITIGSKAGFFNFVGYIDDLRITRGIARYAANFTPPTAAFPDVGLNYDPYWDNVISLLHFDGVNNSTTYVDSAPVPLTWTGNPAASYIGTAQSKFGGAALVSTNIGLTSSATPALGTQDFTVEGWVRPDFLGQKTYFDFSGDHSLAVESSLGTNYLRLADNGTPLIVGNTAMVASVWQHVALTRASGTFRLFLNGVMVGSYTGVISASTPTARIGVPGYYGRVDDYRLTYGVARYTSNFAPPAQAFPNS